MESFSSTLDISHRDIANTCGKKKCARDFDLRLNNCHETRTYTLDMLAYVYLLKRIESWNARELAEEVRAYIKIISDI